MPNTSVAFDRAADYYDNTRGFPPGVETDVAALMARVGGLGASSRVLEIGVGTGRIALPLSRFVRAYVGIDLARPMLDRLVAKRTDEPVFLAQGDVTRLPFATASFDAVIAVHIFHLIPGWRDVLREVTRVLKPGAPLLHGGNERMVVDGLQSVWQKATGEAREAQGAIPTHQRGTFLAEGGWRETAVETVKFSSQRSPNEFMDSIRQRHFSSMWNMSDETLQRGLSAVQAYVAEHFTDPAQPEILEASFKVQAYLPPLT